MTAERRTARGQATSTKVQGRERGFPKQSEDLEAALAEVREHRIAVQRVPTEASGAGQICCTDAAATANAAAAAPPEVPALLATLQRLLPTLPTWLAPVLCGLGERMRQA